MSYFIRVATPNGVAPIVPQYWEQQIVSPSQSNIYYNEGYVGLGIPNPLSRLAVDGGASFGASYYTATAGDGTVLVSGNVGIGTTAPTHKLHVVGTAKIDGDLTVNGTTTTINSETIISDQLIINNAGTGSALIVDQTGAEPIVEFKDDGATVFKIVNGGSVGIGTTLPTTKLDVLGNITASAIDIKGGSPTQVPIHINAGGYTVIPNDGAIERDPQVFYGSTANNLRGVIPCESYYVLREDRQLLSSVVAQEFFPSYVNLLAGTTYVFEAHITMERSAGTTSHQIRSLFGGTATYSKVRYTVSATVLNNVSACVMTSIELPTQIAITPANAVASEINVFKYNGLISVLTSGTFYLQFNYTVAPNGSGLGPIVQSESWMYIKPIGSETFVRNEGGWT